MRAAIAVLMLALLIDENTIMAQSQESPPQTPQIAAERQSNRPAETQQDTTRNNRGASSPASSPQAASNVEKHEATQNINQTDEGASKFWTIFGWRVKITDALLVFFTFLVFCATGLLWWTTRDLVKGAEDTAERQLRAYVLPEKALLININDPTPRYIFHAKNYGQTPAQELTLWVAWRYFDIQKIDIPPTRPAMPDLSKYLLGPQGFTETSDIVYLDDERKRKIRNREAIFFLFGDVRYKDVFGRNRLTTFRFAWGGGYSLDITGPLDVHAEGNDAD